MDTRNHNSENCNDDYDQIIDLLTPKRAPETTMSFNRAALRENHFKVVFRRSLSIAAILAVVVVGGMMLMPKHAYAVPQIIDAAIEKFNNVKTCVIEFTAKVEDKNKGSELFSITPSGRDVSGVFSLIRDGGHANIRIDWKDGGKNYAQIFENDEYRLMSDGIVMERFEVKGIADNLYNLLTASKFQKSLYKDAKMEVVDNLIKILLDSKKNPIKMYGEFSESDGWLLKAGVYFLSAAGQIPILETQRIQYNLPLDKAELFK